MLDEAAGQADLRAVFSVVLEGLHELFCSGFLVLAGVLGYPAQVEQVTMRSQDASDQERLRQAVPVWSWSILGNTYCLAQRSAVPVRDRPSLH